MTAMNAVVRRYCNARTSLVEVFRFLTTTIESQADRAALRNAQLHLPQVAAPQVDAFWFGEPIMGPIRYALGKWPAKFTRDEMEAAVLFCAGNDNAVLDEPDRTEALGNLEFIGDLVVDVDTVAVIVENRSGKNMRYVVLAMNDGSHLCSCRTLQILGLCCDPRPLLPPFLDGDAPQL